MVFWIIAGAMALVAAATLARAALRRPDDAEHPAAYDQQVYRDQLKEVERDLARGVIDAGDADRIRTEISRRILAADAQLRATQGADASGTRSGLPVIVAMGAVLLAGSLLGYWLLGAPGYRDLPLDVRLEEAAEAMANRQSQAEAEAALPPTPPVEPGEEFAALMEKLRQTVAERPGDLQGQQLLARNEAALGNLKAAYQAQEQVIAIKGELVEASDYAMYANLLISAAEGYVSPEAEEALRTALEIDPLENLARYYWGLMMLQNDRPDVTFRIWDQVLRQSPPDAPWVGAIRPRIEDLAWFAGVNGYTAPPPPHSGLSGPSAGDVDAAQDMSAEDRQEMIRGMVDGLAERLATEGGSPEEWARLLNALGVLGEADRAALIWAEAQSVFAEAPEALEIVREGARRIGLVD